MDDIRAITSDITWQGADGSHLPGTDCLCWVNIPQTLIDAGFKVWRNPDSIPEYLCERVEEEAACELLGMEPKA
ncbi:hypothetical protein [Aureimonas glaciei]|nr:hypothetical protein [Aureimonas glaciei]